jgi:DNA-binding response OmpR family regulator
VRIGDIVIDPDRLAVTLAGEPVALTTREVLVLRYLAQHHRRVITRAQLLQQVWGQRYTGDDRTVDVHISRLRRKLPPLRGVLCAVRHIGYRLDLGAFDRTTGRRAASS